MRLPEYRARLEEIDQSLHRRYYLDMPQAPSSVLADILAFDGTRAIGEPTKYTIIFTHPSHTLSRTEYIGNMATFVIQPPPVARDGSTGTEPASKVKGVMTGFACLSRSRDESTYEIVLESRLALMHKRPKCASSMT
ncbi:Rhs element Vgr protein [Candidatus Paraburkholderia kirkii]|nr:Rhs element Vgr protein [Candidatus Paraburkholderia kirkii]